MYKNSWNQYNSKLYAANDTDNTEDITRDTPMTLPSYPSDTPMTLPSYPGDTPMTLPSYPDADTPTTLPSYPDADTPMTLPSYPDVNPSIGGPVAPSGTINFPMTLPSFPDTPVASPLPPAYPNVPVAKGCNIRILHADQRVGAVNVILSGVTLVTNLTYGTVSAYSQEASGTLLVTVVSSANEYQYLIQETLRFNNGDTYTLAIIPNGMGSTIFQIADISCNKSLYNSCMRAINLATGNAALDVSLLDGRTIARNLTFKGIGSYKQFTPGRYRVIVYENACENHTTAGNIQTGTVNIIPIIIGSGGGSCMTRLLKASQIQIASNRLYTIYLLGSSRANDNNELLLLFVESSFD